jgi:hypothetical protein
MSFSLEGYFGNLVTKIFFKLAKGQNFLTLYILLSLKISFFIFYFHLLSHSRPPLSLLIIFSFFFFSSPKELTCKLSTIIPM